MLFVVVLSPLAAVCQSKPADSSSSAQSTVLPYSQPPQTRSHTAAAEGQPGRLTPPDKQWRKIQKLPMGTAVVVDSTYGQPLQCRFADATDDGLYCDTPESPDGTGWVFERPSVISVQATILQRNHHPGWMAATLAGGLIVGVLATRSTSAGNAAKAGAIGALITGGAGVPLAMSTPDSQWVTVVYRPRVSRVQDEAAHRAASAK